MAKSWSDPSKQPLQLFFLSFLLPVSLGRSLAQGSLMNALLLREAGVSSVEKLREVLEFPFKFKDDIYQ